MMTRKAMLTFAALAAATPALAGEVTGTGSPTPIDSFRAHSLCAFSGLNDDGLGPSSLVQAYGMFIKVGGPGSALSPSIGCRGN
ncbi:hypothetical protein HMF7854_03090 [Sphingomonas ginkgonis]|uniref:Secreted protein n=1 Tax=Sphingomonas ginkgonis TaxID=2315330 RepID=A0A429V7G8_9SPHN|nr:hypothetical protein [Sphingomonas ginkgonis]RST29921.1 hypothetical protein HMF7854_03090 [Sphingomonas ginkgonis]